jgi:hypothetical protein
MTSSFASAPPSNEFADARTPLFPDGLAHQAGAKSKSSLKRTAKSLSSFQRTFAFSPLA